MVLDYIIIIMQCVKYFSLFTVKSLFDNKLIIQTHCACSFYFYAFKPEERVLDAHQQTLDALVLLFALLFPSRAPI